MNKKQIVLVILFLGTILPLAFGLESSTLRFIKKIFSRSHEGIESVPVSSTGVSIVFDLSGVLLDNDTTKAMNELGVSDLSYYSFWHRINPLSIKEALLKKTYEIFNKIQKEGNRAKACDPYGSIMPGIMCDWQKSLKTNAELLVYVNTAILKNPAWFSSSIEKKLVRCVINKMFNPERLISTVRLIPEGLAFVKECKKAGHRLFVLSNWDKESVERLLEKFPDLFELFDEILISGDVHCMKPEKDSYAPFVKRKNMYNEILILIDDQKENVQAACSEGLCGIWCKPQSSFLGIAAKPDFMAIEKAVSSIINKGKFAANSFLAVSAK